MFLPHEYRFCVIIFITVSSFLSCLDISFLPHQIRYCVTIFIFASSHLFLRRYILFLRHRFHYCVIILWLHYCFRYRVITFVTASLFSLRHRFRFCDVIFVNASSFFLLHRPHRFRFCNCVVIFISALSFSLLRHRSCDYVILFFYSVIIFVTASSRFLLLYDFPESNFFSSRCI